MNIPGRGRRRSRVSSPHLASIGVLLFALVGGYAAAAAPALYTQPAYESPVRADPDDLLLIPGYGLSAADTVVYEAVINTTAIPPHPSSAPASSVAQLGIAPLVSAADAPYSLTVQLPAVTTQDQSYALWVVTPDNQWSAPLLINDARPLWITPEIAYQTASLANLPRMVKVVGRNLQPGPGAGVATQVRFVGQNTGTTYTLTAHNTYNDDSGNSTAALERYVAAVDLPATLVADIYTIQVSRDGTSWVALLGNGQSAAQTFEVDPDPVAPPTFSVGSFTDPRTNAPCVPNDNIDDTACILLAIRAAAQAGGGTVMFGPGTWTMSAPGQFVGGYTNILTPESCVAPNSPQTCGVSWFGVLVPVGVNLQGSGSSGATTTTIERGTGWIRDATHPLPTFTLQGSNTVSGFVFLDDNDYSGTTAGQPGPMLQLGNTYYFARYYGTSDPLTVSKVTITQNLFNKPLIAIQNGGLPSDHVYITYNIFGGAYTTAILLQQVLGEVDNLLPSSALPYQTYHMDDFIIDYNTFYPSGWAATAANYAGNGSVATQLNTDRRMDFSNNVADGTATQYFYPPGTEPKGWRAAYFWSNGANEDMTLVSNNIATCPGDKYGDGEAIAYDGGGTLGGMLMAQPVISSAPWTDPHGVPGTSVTVQGSLITVLHPNSSTSVDISSSDKLNAYYAGFWLQIVQGTGKGQWRKVALGTAASQPVSLGSNAAGSTVTINVTPAFDVPPDGASSVVFDRAYWQLLTVNNQIDQRQPPCTKANTRGGGSGGHIMWYASTADSVIEGNQQYDTNGILVHHNYNVPAPSSSPAPAGLVLQSSNEIRNNLIDGTYNWSSSQQGGVNLGYGALDAYCSTTCTPAPVPPDLGFGISIAGNTIIQSDNRDGMSSTYPPIGAIALSRDWSTGPQDASGLNLWQLGDTTLVFHNSLQNISDTLPGSVAGAPHIGLGIDTPVSHSPSNSWRSILYSNTCRNVDIPMSATGIGTVRYCPSNAGSTCDCSGIGSVDVGVSAVSSSTSVSIGGSVAYTVTITNNDTTNTASAVALSVEPSAGVQLSAGSLTSSQGSCDASVNLCSLGNLQAGGTASVSVTAVLPTAGSWPVTFSVTHQDADSVVANDGAMITVSAE